ncbi:MAG: class I SAM-dependent methyltransferase [Verrucomicrobiota bacterium]
MPPCAHPATRLEPLFPASDYITGHPFKIARCGACGFTITLPQPAPEQMDQYYPAGYYGAPGGRRFPAPVEFLQRRLYAARVSWVESAASNRQPGRVLDVGCGRGWLLKAFQDRGWQVQGTELSDTASAYAREVLKLPVRIGSLESLNFPAESFDAITLWHVLEHLSDPRSLIEEARRILRPGGVLMIGVPDFGGWEARWTEGKWFHLDVPRHLTHLTRPTLAKALAERGFREVAWHGFAPEYDLFSFVQSLLNRTGLRHNLLYNFLRRGRAKVLQEEGASASQLLATLALAVPLTLIGIPATCIAGLAGKGGTMTVVAVRE